MEVASLQKKMAVGQNLPTVAVGAGYNYHDVLDNDRGFGMVFATVSVPISDWWGGSHAIKRKKIGAGTSKMSDLLQAQLLYQQSLDRRTDAYADYQNKLLEYRHATGQ